MIKYMLDTNICIFAIKSSSVSLIEKIRSLSPQELCISSITLCELSYGVARSKYKEKNEEALEKMVSSLEVLPFDPRYATSYGTTRAFLEAKGTPIGPLDTLIAAHALAIRAILITNNTREFKRVPGLKIEDWSLG